MTGMDRETGKPLGGTAHLQQSLRDILSTLLGTRVGRREYGSLVSEMVDQPGNALGRQRLIAAIVAAIARWEPRLRLTRVGFSAAGADGTFTVGIHHLSSSRLLSPPFSYQNSVWSTKLSM